MSTVQVLFVLRVLYCTLYVYSMMGGAGPVARPGTFLLSRAGKLLGLDVGLKSVGVAVSDPTRTVALPLGILGRRKGPGATAKALKRAVEAHGVVGLVVGWPLELSGREGRQCSMVLKFIGDMERHGVLAELPFVLHDERFTTAMAREGLQSMGRGRKAIAERHDAVAAAEILADYIAGGELRDDRGLLD